MTFPARAITVSQSSSRGGLGGKRKTMFTHVFFVSAPGGSNPARGYINRSDIEICCRNWQCRTPDNVYDIYT